MTAQIMIVEDDPVSRSLLSSLLTARGYAVDEAVDGFGALRLAQDKAYDLIFIDYHLPEMDGYALARLMRTLGEKTNTNLNMVAITADAFGLAARRGADCLFDRILTKPFAPDALYAFCDAFLLPSSDTAVIDAFLEEPTPAEAQNAGDLLWRVRGLDERPAIAVFPEPSATEREGLDYCFRLVDAEAAEGLLLLRQSGTAALEHHRCEARNALQPLFVLDDGHQGIGDATFAVGNGESWTAVAAMLKRFRDRRGDIDADTLASRAFEQRLRVYLHLAGTQLTLRRDELGRATLPYTGGFPSAKIVAAIKQLSAAGIVEAKINAPGAEGSRELLVSLTRTGTQTMLRKDARERQEA